MHLSGGLERHPGGGPAAAAAAAGRCSPPSSAPGWPSPGAAYQGVFRNPLADPYLLGAAAGAGLGATLVIAYSPTQTLGPFGVVPLAAFVGALVGVGCALALGTAAGGSHSATLLLAGVAVASFLAAAQTLVQQQNTDDLREVYGWLLGQLGRAQWSDVVLVLPYLVPACLVLLLCGRALDVLAVGDDEASALGVHPGRLRLIVILAASLATAAAVAVSGLIGFVGLVVPHIARRLVGGSHARVLPVSLLIGGGVPGARRPDRPGRPGPRRTADRRGDRLRRRALLRRSALGRGAAPMSDGTPPPAGPRSRSSG